MEPTILWIVKQKTIFKYSYQTAPYKPILMIWHCQPLILLSQFLKILKQILKNFI